MENLIEHVWDVGLPFTAAHSNYCAHLFDGECFV